MRTDADLVAALRAAADGPVCAYVYDLDGLRDHATAAVAALPDGCELFYAVKANSQRPVLEALAGVVAGLEGGAAGGNGPGAGAGPRAPLAFRGPRETHAPPA